MPCGSQIVTTEPLSRDQALGLMPNNHCVEDCNYLLDYFRLTADNRLLYGGGVWGARTGRHRGVDPAQAAAHLSAVARREDQPSAGGTSCYAPLRQADRRSAARPCRRFDAFAKLPHLPFPGGRRFKVPLTAMGAAGMR